MATDQPLHGRDHRGAASHEMKGDNPPPDEVKWLNDAGAYTP
jgi:hypothetical protein